MAHLIIPGGPLSMTEAASLLDKIGIIPAIALTLDTPFADVRRIYVDAALQAYGGNCSAVARRLGTSRRTIQRTRTPPSPKPKRPSDIL